MHKFVGHQKTNIEHVDGHKWTCSLKVLAAPATYMMMAKVPCVDLVDMLSVIPLQLSCLLLEWEYA